MDGWKLRGKRMRSLREEAGLHRDEVAAALNCSVGHLKNVEIETNADRNQLGAVRVQQWRRFVGKHLGRNITMDEIGEPDTGSKRDDAA